MGTGKDNKIWRKNTNEKKQKIYCFGIGSSCWNGVKFDSNQAGKNRGLRVLGMALHVSGDAFAHKALVPNDSNTEKYIKDQPGVKAIFKSKIKEKFEDGTLTTAGLSKICKQNGISKADANEMFEDNTKFLPKRYTLGAQNATKCLLRDYYKNAKFDINMFSHGKNDIKQYKLAEFVNEAKKNYRKRAEG